MGKMWKLAIATWFAVVATPAPSFSVAQDRLIDLPDGRLALSFAGREVLLPKTDEWEILFTSAPRYFAPEEKLTIAEGQARQRRNYWRPDRIIKERDAFEQILREESALRLLYDANFDPAEFQAPLIYKNYWSRYSRTPEEIVRLRTQFTLFIKLSRQPDYVYEKDYNANINSVARRLAENPEADRLNRDFVYRSERSTIVSNKELNLEGDYLPNRYIIHPKRFRLFAADNDLYVTCFTLGNICNKYSWSRDRRVNILTRFSSVWDPASFPDVDLHSHRYLRNIFLNGFPEGLE